MTEKWPEDGPLVAVRRGGAIESLHRGRISVCEKDGEELWGVGDGDGYAFLRSAAKPFQALALIHTGAAGALGLTDKEVAVACGSHSGEEGHVEAVLSILRKAGLGEEHLQNGAHAPMHRPSARRLAAAGERPRAIHGNCSGKHAGMLACCAHMGWDIEGYMIPEHPLQRLIVDLLAEACDTEATEILLATDGCGVPAFALPLRGLATVFARLAEGEGELAKILYAMRTHPWMVAGTGRLDTELMEGADMVSKIGADGVLACASSHGWGMAVKVSDGAQRAVAPAVLGALERLGTEHTLDEQKYTVLTNLRNERVGELSVVF